ncbi:hypothetical protein EDD30_1249 [Couchioplanes caeruleus]|uniref:Uncharacterized protein n=1 Tax=Couchioplanes caeruleus TaxID=56438 RepID=A0A3N1GE61_9ACTN|nr:hypothetical protein EDD30_1249 [Couchioplanes caeruleus]
MSFTVLGLSVPIAAAGPAVGAAPGSTTVV